MQLVHTDADATAEYLPDAQLVHAVDVTVASTPVPAAVSGCPGWKMAGGNVSITAVTGLTSGHRYELTFLVLG